GWGIIRAGRRVEIGRLEHMRHLSALHVDAEMDGVVPDLSNVPGVTAVRIDGRTVRCQVTAPVEPLLRVLVDAGVRHLVSTEPSLEELFLAHYGDGEARIDAP